MPRQPPILQQIGRAGGVKDLYSFNWRKIMVSKIFGSENWLNGVNSHSLSLFCPSYMEDLKETCADMPKKNKIIIQI